MLNNPGVDSATRPPLIGRAATTESQPPVLLPVTGVPFAKPVDPFTITATGTGTQRPSSSEVDRTWFQSKLEPMLLNLGELLPDAKDLIQKLREAKSTEEMQEIMKTVVELSNSRTVSDETRSILESLRIAIKNERQRGDSRVAGQSTPTAKDSSVTEVVRGSETRENLKDAYAALELIDPKIKQLLADGLSLDKDATTNRANYNRIVAMVKDAKKGGRITDLEEQFIEGMIWTKVKDLEEAQQHKIEQEKLVDTEQTKLMNELTAMRLESEMRMWALLSSEDGSQVQVPTSLINMFNRINQRNVELQEKGNQEATKRNNAKVSMAHDLDKRIFFSAQMGVSREEFATAMNQQGQAIVAAKSGSTAPKTTTG